MFIQTVAIIMCLQLNCMFRREIIIILTHHVCTGCRHNVLWDELQVLEGDYHYPDSQSLYRLPT